MLHVVPRFDNVKGNFLVRLKNDMFNLLFTSYFIMIDD